MQGEHSTRRPDGDARARSPFADEREVWRAAILLLQQLGPEALPLARDRSRRAAAADDQTELVIWRSVAAGLAELLREPKQSEWRN